MKICAIDSSGLVAGVAVFEDGIMKSEYCVHHKITHSETLLPMLNEVSTMTDLDMNSIDAFAIAAGPGSFTGLRIGAATVKGLGLVIDKPVVSVPTLEALAYNAYGNSGIICPIMDARRGQVYTAAYSFIYRKDKKDYLLNPIIKMTACSFEELCERLNTLKQRVLFIGDGIPVFEADMPELLQVDYSLAPAHMNRQRAGSLAALAEYYLNNDVQGLEGCITSADEMTPIYLRLSQAEREKKEREVEA